MIHSRGVAFDFQKSVEHFHKGGYKLRSSVGDHLQWGAMKFEYVVLEYSSYSFGGKICWDGEETDHFWKSINYREDCILSLGFGKRTDNVDGDDLSWGLWDFIWLERGLIHLWTQLNFLAFVTSADIFGDVLANGEPVVFGEDKILGSMDSRMSCKWVVMMLLDYSLMEWIVFWNVEEVFVQKYALWLLPMRPIFCQSFESIFLSFVLEYFYHWLNRFRVAWVLSSLSVILNWLFFHPKRAHSSISFNRRVWWCKKVVREKDMGLVIKFYPLS